MVTSSISVSPRTSSEPKPNYQSTSRLVIRAKAPLRISFAGGGTDVPPYPEREGGCVLNATINRFAWGSLRQRNDGSTKLESVDLGLCLEFKADDDMPLNGQLDLVKAALKRLE